MKKIKRIIRKAVLKSITFVAYSILSVFSFALKALFKVYRFTALPAAVILLMATAYDLFSMGFDPMRAGTVVLCVALIVLQFVLPQLHAFLTGIRYSMKNYLDRPIIVRSIYKFSM